MESKKEIEKIPIEDAIELLRQEGIIITLKEAELIMDFLYTLALLIITESFD